MKNYDFLLNRPEHTFDDIAIDGSLAGKRILVTGAGGSIGSALVKRLIESPAAFVGAVGHSELPLFNLRQRYIPEHKLAEAVVDVQNTEDMEWLLDLWKPDFVIHAAAHKHVGLMESQPEQALHNNTLATTNFARIALKSESVRRFVFISTDKACNPTSVMGASKRLAELWLKSHAMPFAVVCRFGNVLGSSGSLVEIAERKAAAGEPITVSDPRMTRFFITAKEAVGLVLTAALLEEGDAFSIDMGQPIPILELLEKLCPDAMLVTANQAGSGEKLNEEVVAESEYTFPTANPAVFKIAMQDNPLIDQAIERLIDDPSKIVEITQAL